MAKREHNYQPGRIRRSGAEGAAQQNSAGEAQQVYNPAGETQRPPATPRQRLSDYPAARGSVASGGQPASLFDESQQYGGPQTYRSPAAGNAAVRQKPQKSRLQKALTAVIIVLAILLALIIGLYFFADSFLNTGLLGNRVDPGYVPKAYRKSQVVNILIVGIDNEEGRDYGAGLGLTDMILYANFNIQDNQLNLLQIPRDSYVGEEVPTGGTGKINAALISGPNKDSPINNLANVIEQQFKLPIDHYVAMDMDALRDIVDGFGGLEVYVPREMSYNGSYLPQGWHVLDGASAEFFVRNRKGPGFERADIDRLDNQRHFYSALFRRFMELTPGDIVKLLPVFKEYCNTDISVTDLIDLAFSAMNLESENVLFCKVPGTTGPELDPTGNGRNMYFIDIYGRGTEEDPGTAELLNRYFRSYGSLYAADELALPDITIPAGYTLYSPNIQQMSGVQEGEGA